MIRRRWNGSALLPGACPLADCLVVAFLLAALLLASLGRGGEERAPQVLNALEKKFQEDLHNAVLAGKWRLVKDGKLGEEREDRYTIRSVAKVGEDLWMVGARIEYGGKDVTIPVPVKVFWAGDTPVISVTNAGIPGLGTYTARVMIYGGQYTGTWSAPDHAGFLSGVIVKEGSEGPAGPEKSTGPGKPDKPREPAKPEQTPVKQEAAKG